MTLIAVEIRDKEATFVRAEKTSSARLCINQVQTIELDRLFSDEGTPSGNNSEDIDAFNAETLAQNKSVSDLIPESIQSSALLISNNNVLYEQVELPFKDSRKIERVAPLQIQDNLPFDIDDYLVDNHLVGKSSENSYKILSSLIPKKEVALNLAELSQFDIDPEVVSSRAGALSSTIKLFPEISGTYAVISLSPQVCSLIIVVQDEVKELRDVPVYSNGAGQDSLARDIKSSLARTEGNHEAIIETVYLAEGEDLLRELLAGLPVKLCSLDTNRLIENQSGVDRDFSWALGLFAQNLTSKDREIEHIVNFRVGPFAYKPMWKNFVSAAKEEMPYFIAAFVVCTLYVISLIVSGERHLSQVESAIEQRLVKTNLEGLAYGLEASTVESKILELEEQLLDVGSLSSLSPLEGLKVLSTTFDKSIDVHIDAINIRPASISFRGTVPDLTSVGRLSTALEKYPDKFCKVVVDPKGKDQVQNRFRYSADIELCT